MSTIAIHVAVLWFDVSHASVRLRRTLNVVGARIGDGSGSEVEQLGVAVTQRSRLVTLCVLGGAGDGLETPRESLEEEKILPVMPRM